ncbi:hypothetical protein PVAG01_06711 [Phlyctema vagabunda]|uniref:Uncharacterized protein n=1 Tax=Phlyctema vagabunda TaxID=108571 RepID=A0ABR4PGZ4_9HELO
MASTNPTGAASISTSQLIRNAIASISSASAADQSRNPNVVVLVSALHQLLYSEACDEENPLDGETQQAVLAAVQLLFNQSTALDVDQMVRFLGAVYVLAVVCVNGLCVAEEGDESGSEAEEQDEGGGEVASEDDIKL